MRRVRPPAPSFTPPALLRGPHFQTIVPALLGSSGPALPAGEPLRFTATDGAPLCGVGHWQPGARAEAPAAVLLHGVEGTAESAYMRRTAAKLLARGWHVVRLDHRGCGAGEALTPTIFHGGRSDDVAAVLAELGGRHGIGELAAIGFSLGGGVLLRLLGERGRVPGLVAAAAVSPLIHPAAVQRHLDRPQSALYRRYFLEVMAARMRRRAALFPGHFPAWSYRCRTLLEYDDRVTAPLTGYSSAADYYRRVDALPLLPAIATPTLLLHAQDDPLVPFAALGRIAAGRDLHLEFPARGGHLGFFAPGRGVDGYWAENRIIDFVVQARCN